MGSYQFQEKTAFNTFFTYFLSLLAINIRLQNLALLFINKYVKYETIKIINIYHLLVYDEEYQ